MAEDQNLAEQIKEIEEQLAADGMTSEIVKRLSEVRKAIDNSTDPGAPALQQRLRNIYAP